MKYKVQAAVEVIVEADNSDEAKREAKAKITSRTDVKILCLGYVGEFKKDE